MDEGLCNVVLLLLCPEQMLLVAVVLPSPVAQLPWGQPAGCQSPHLSLLQSQVHPWAVALGTGKQGSAHTLGPGGSHIGTGRAGHPVWASSWLWEEEWTQGPKMIPGPQNSAGVPSPSCVISSTFFASISPLLVP